MLWSGAEPTGHGGVVSLVNGPRSRRGFGDANFHGPARLAEIAFLLAGVIALFLLGLVAMWWRGLL